MRPREGTFPNEKPLGVLANSLIASSQNKYIQMHALLNRYDESPSIDKDMEIMWMHVRVHADGKCSVRSPPTMMLGQPTAEIRSVEARVIMTSMTGLHTKTSPSNVSFLSSGQPSISHTDSTCSNMHR